MFSLSAPYHLSQSSETWSSMMSPGYLGPEDAYYTNQPTYAPPSAPVTGLGSTAA